MRSDANPGSHPNPTLTPPPPTPPPSPGVTATRMGMLDWMRDEGAELHVPGDNGVTILHSAANKGPYCLMDWVLAQDNGALFQKL